MKFAFCLFRYFPHGGLQRDFLRIAHECLRRGHQVDVFTMQWEGDREPGLSIQILKTMGITNHQRRINFAKQLKPKLEQQHYDLVVGFNKMPGLDVYYAADTCYQAKARGARGFWYRLTGRYRHTVAFEQAVFSKEVTTEILMIAKQQQQEFQRYYQTPAERFSLLPPGIDRDRIAPHNATELREKKRQELNLTASDHLILMIGSGFRTKGVDRALHALASLPTVVRKRSQLMIIGKDNAFPFLRLAKKLHMEEQVHFLGGRDDVPAYLLAADVLLHPAYNENTGTVLLEAIVSGLPVLTTDVCGYAGYVESAKAGIVLASPFQQAQLNQALLEMLLSPARQHWRENAIAFAKQADIYDMPARAVTLIESFG